MADGTLNVGSRTRVTGLPVWVTPEVVRGGFATGAAAAGGPMRSYEIEMARRVGLPADRRALFGYCLTEAGLRELTGRLADGRYRVEVPEHVALLVVAWLAAAGDREGAMALVDTIAPFSGQLGFVPPPGPGAASDPDRRRRLVGTGQRILRRRLQARLPPAPERSPARPLATVKNTAYAWRQMLFFLSMIGQHEHAAFLESAQDRLAAHPPHIGACLAPAMAGLEHVIAGGRFDHHGAAGNRRRPLGWTITHHWMLAERADHSDGAVRH
jgi:hypothetical protein